MTALPEQGNLIVPIAWQGQTQKNEMQAAGYKLGGTIGWRPYSATATLSWILTKEDANDLLETFNATNWNGVYTYTCEVRGSVKVRLTGEFEFEERFGEQLVTVSAGVETV